MAILLNNGGDWHDVFRAAIGKYLPGRDVQAFPDIQDPDAINYAMIWKHPAGDLERYPNLKAVFSLGTGVDYIDAYPTLPDAPIFRLIDPAMADDMALYTLHWVVHFQRLIPTYQAQQKEARWQRYPTPLAPDYHVAVLGLGAIGSHIAGRLAANGFKTSGWSRGPKQIDGINCLHGAAGLREVLQSADVMVCCLPLTRSTRHFLDRTILSQLKPGGFVINVSRGGVIHDPDLLSLLDDGHIAGAALDVFAPEPLPRDSRYWSHPNVHVTPHMSGATNPDTAVKIIAGNIERFERGDMPPYRYMREDGV